MLLAVLALPFVLYASYWQTITAYPSNGGSYTVASENLGRPLGLLAATALMVDYALNVAVGISAGIGALTSAAPSLAPHTLALCLAVLVLVTVVNLRGTPDAGAVFALPTYSVYWQLGGDPRSWAMGCRYDGRPSADGCTAARRAEGNRHFRFVDRAVCLRQWLHGDDRGRSGQQRCVRFQEGVMHFASVLRHA